MRRTDLANALLARLSRIDSDPWVWERSIAANRYSEYWTQSWPVLLRQLWGKTQANTWMPSGETHEGDLWQKIVVRALVILRRERLQKEKARSAALGRPHLGKRGGTFKTVIEDGITKFAKDDEDTSDE